MIIGAICEFSGVFLLSVEAIKLKNLRWVRTSLKRLYSERFNPYIEFHNDAPSSPYEAGPRHMFGEGIAAFLVMFVMTPFAILTYVLYQTLEAIERFAAPGAVGIIGFTLWTVSLLIEKIA